MPGKPVFDHSFSANPWVWAITFKRVPEVPAGLKARPIIFSGPMVRALLDGRKTQTRRVVKFQTTDCLREIVTRAGYYALLDENIGLAWHPFGNSPLQKCPQEIIGKFCPFGKPGDFLWLRETFAVYSPNGPEFGIGYREHHPTGNLDDGDGGYNFRAYADDERERSKQRSWVRAHCNLERWISPIHMPRWASRLTLQISDVRVQRVQDISEEDARAEGVTDMWPTICQTHKYNCIQIWDSIHVKRSRKAVA